MKGETDKLVNDFLSSVDKIKSKELVSLNTTVIVGAAIRRGIINSLKNLCFLHNVKVNIEEDKGWLESYYRIKMTGERGVVSAIVESLKNQMKDLDND